MKVSLRDEFPSSVIRLAGDAGCHLMQRSPFPSAELPQLENKISQPTGLLCPEGEGLSVPHATNSKFTRGEIRPIQIPFGNSQN